MINSLDLTSKLAIDTKNVDELQLLAQQDSKKALQEAAKQFEALFLQMLVKSMRDATLKSGLIDSQQTQFYTEMYDQQLAQSISAKGIGLADMMVEQLTRTYNSQEEQSKSFATPVPKNQFPINPTVKTDNSQITETNGPSQLHGSYNRTVSKIPEPDNLSTLSSATTADKSNQLWPDSAITAVMSQTVKNTSPDKTTLDHTDSNTQAIETVSNKPADFINALMPYASQATQSTGIPAHFMVAQAALESGWGKYEIRHPDNSPSYNLFGIKAGSNWQGQTVETVTTEYEMGVPLKMVEKFRAYESYTEAFEDYAKLLSQNSRYAEVLNTKNAVDFAHGLQRAGYATDPQYADKLLRILNNNTALHNQEAI